mgnify:FL=1
MNEKALNLYLIEISKLVESETKNEKATYKHIGDIEFDGMKDFVFCTNDVNEENKYEKQENEIQLICIQDPKINASKLEFKIVQKKESIYLINRPFDYENSNGVFMKLYPEEEFPLHIGSVIKMGTKTQFIVERFNTGIIAAPGKRSNMEDNFLVVQDMKLHP